MGALAADRINASEINVGSVIRVERNAAGNLVTTRRKRGALTVTVTGKDAVTVPGGRTRRYVLHTTAGDTEPCVGVQTFPIGDSADLVDAEAPAGDQVDTVPADVDQVDSDEKEAPRVRTIEEVTHCGDESHTAGVAGCPPFVLDCQGYPNGADIETHEVRERDTTGSAEVARAIAGAITGGAKLTVTDVRHGHTDPYGRGPKYVRPVSVWSMLVNGRRLILTGYESRTFAGTRSYGCLTIDGAPVAEYSEEGTDQPATALNLANSPATIGRMVAWRVRRHFDALAEVDQVDTLAPALTTVPARGGADRGPVVVAVVSHGDVTDRAPAGDQVDGAARLLVASLSDGSDQPAGEISPAPAGELAPVVQLPAPADGDQVDPATVRDVLSRCTWSHESIRHSRRGPYVLADVLKLPRGERIERPVYLAVADQVARLGGGKWLKGTGWPFEPSRMVWDPSAPAGGRKTKSGPETLAAWLAAGSVDQVDSDQPASVPAVVDQVDAVTVPTIDGVPAGLPYLVDMPADWPGAVRRLQPTEVGAMLRGPRGFLAAWFPGVKFSVRSTWSDGITIRWEDGPAGNVVSLVAEMWKSKGFDGMTDSTTYRGPVLYVDAAGHAEALDLPGVYLSTSRTITDRAALAAFNLLKDYPETLAHSEFRDPFGRPFYGGSRQDCARWMTSMGVDEWARTGSRDGAPCEVDRCALKSGHPWAPVHVNDYGRAFFGVPADGDGDQGGDGGEPVTPLPTDQGPDAPASAADQGDTDPAPALESWGDLAALITGAPADHGFICKTCEGPAPVGVGYVADGADAARQSAGLTSCACGNSQTAPAVDQVDTGREPTPSDDRQPLFLLTDDAYAARGFVLREDGRIVGYDTAGRQLFDRKDQGGAESAAKKSGHLLVASGWYGVGSYRTADAVAAADSVAGAARLVEREATRSAPQPPAEAPAVDQVGTVPAAPAVLPNYGDRVTVAGWSTSGFMLGVVDGRAVVDVVGEVSRVPLGLVDGVEILTGDVVAEMARQRLAEPHGVPADLVDTVQLMAGRAVWTSGKPEAGMLIPVPALHDSKGQRRENVQLLAEKVDKIGCGCYRIEAYRPGPVDPADNGYRSWVHVLTGCSWHESHVSAPVPTSAELTAAADAGRQSYRDGIPTDAPGEAPEVTALAKRYPVGDGPAMLREMYRHGYASAAERGAADAVRLLGGDQGDTPAEPETSGSVADSPAPAGKPRKRPAVGAWIHHAEHGTCEVVAVHGRGGEDIAVRTPAGERVELTRWPRESWLLVDAPAVDQGEESDDEPAEGWYRLPVEAYAPELAGDVDAELIIRHDHEDGTVLEGSSKGDGVLEIARRHRFQWRRFAGVHIPGSRDTFADLHTLAKLATDLREAGHTVGFDLDDVWRPAGVREGHRAARVEARVERLTERAGKKEAASLGRRAAEQQIANGMPFAEPIKIGHHSERAHRRAFDRMDNHRRAAMELHDYARHLAGRADGALANERAKYGPRAIMRRVERLKADRRGWIRRLADTDKGTTGYARKCRLHIEMISEDIAYQLAHLGDLAASGAFVAWSAETVAKGDRVAVGHGRWCEVTRINRKGVSVVDRFGWGAAGTVTWDEIHGRRREVDGVWMQWDAPNGEPWPVATARQVERWADLVSRHETCTSYDRTAEVLTARRHVAHARRIMVGLPVTATAQEVDAFPPLADEAGRRAYALGAVGVFDRLQAGEKVADVVADTVPVVAGEPAWRMPEGEPEDVNAAHLVPGDIVAGVIDGFAGSRAVSTSIVGPVQSVPRHEDRREAGDVYHVTINGTPCELRSFRWLKVHRRR